MDILPIQGLAVPCEHVFSSTKETMSAHQNHILLELMEALQMLKFLVQKGQGLSFTEGWDKESELRELEKLASDEGMIPEDMMAFIVSLDEYKALEWICNSIISIYRRSCGLSHSQPKPDRASHSCRLSSEPEPKQGQASKSHTEPSPAKPRQH